MDCLKDKLSRNISPYGLFSRYFGASLLQRIGTPHWFENRFIQAALRDTGWIGKYERLFTEANIAVIKNSDKIFNVLYGADPDYDLKIFDALAEVRLINWAKENGYSNIEKLIPSTQKTPDFIMKKGKILTVAEAKHFRDRNYLPEFVQDRLTGLVLKTGCLSKFGISVNTTYKYDQELEVLLKNRLKSEYAYRELVREEITEEWLIKLDASLVKDPEQEIEIVKGFFVVSRNEVPCDAGVIFSPSTNGEVLMLEKLGGNLMTGLKQIKVFFDNSDYGMIPVEALVFLSGTDSWSIEWESMWHKLLEEKRNSAWEQVEKIYKDARKLAGVPFKLIVGKDNPVKYICFPWNQSEIN